MTAEVLLGVAVAASAGAAYVVVAPDRLPAAGAPDARPRVVRLAGGGWLVPVPGAPGVGVRVLLGAAATAMAVSLLPGLQGVIAGIVVGAGGFLAVGRLGTSAAASARVELASALPVICTQLAACLEAGLPLRNAVAVLGECLGGEPAGVFRRLDAAVRLGVPEERAWWEAGERSPELAGLAREVRHAATGGVALARALRRHADEARATVRSAAESRARRAGVSIVLPLAICFLPAFLLVGVVPVVGGVLSRLLG